MPGGTANIAEDVSIPDANRIADPPISVDASDSASDLTFDETASHLWALREERQQLEMVVEAITGLSFQVSAVVERRLLYGGDDDPNVYPDGYSVWAHYPDPKLPMVLYVPHDLADEFEQAGREPWHGRGTVIGWDWPHGRLQVKIEQRI